MKQSAPQIHLTYDLITVPNRDVKPVGTLKKHFMFTLRADLRHETSVCFQKKFKVAKTIIYELVYNY